MSSLENVRLSQMSLVMEVSNVLMLFTVRRFFVNLCEKCLLVVLPDFFFEMNDDNEFLSKLCDSQTFTVCNIFASVHFFSLSKS